MDTSGEALIDSVGIRAETGGKSAMTIWRWQRDPRVNFPPPDITINGRNYWRRSTIRKWQRDMAARSEKSGVAPQRAPEMACAN